MGRASLAWRHHCILQAPRSSVVARSHNAAGLQAPAHGGEHRKSPQYKPCVPRALKRLLSFQPLISHPQTYSKARSRNAHRFMLKAGHPGIKAKGQTSPARRAGAARTHHTAGCYAANTTRIVHILSLEISDLQTRKLQPWCGNTRRAPSGPGNTGVLSLYAFLYFPKSLEKSRNSLHKGSKNPVLFQRSECP